MRVLRRSSPLLLSLVMYPKTALDRFADTLNYPEEIQFRAVVEALPFQGELHMCTGSVLDRALRQAGLPHLAETFHERYLNFTVVQDVIPPVSFVCPEPKESGVCPNVFGG